MTSSLQQALSLHQAGHIAEADALYAEILEAEPGNCDAHQYRGVLRYQQGRLAEALALIETALAIDPDSSTAHANHGLVLQAMGRLQDALAAFDRALALAPDYLAAHRHRGKVLIELGRHDAALPSLARAHALRPGNPETLYLQGMALAGLKRREEALRVCEAALRSAPKHVDALVLRGHLLFHLGRHADAVDSFSQALALEPGLVEPLASRGIALGVLGRLTDSAASLEEVLRIKPDHEYASSALAQVARSLCDWQRTRAVGPLLCRNAARSDALVAPFALIGYSDDPRLLRQCAENYLRKQVPADLPAWPSRRLSHDRLRVAYLSQDFRDHATAVLIAGMIEQHDRGKFEIIGISLAAGDTSAMRTRIVKAFDKFHDVSDRSDADVAALLYRLEIDIAVDLNAHTQAPRPAILAGRPAPVQINYLGYPGTSGADFVDYIFGDSVVTPFADQEFFSEYIVQLPHSYQVTDGSRPIDAATPSRAEAGLPDDGFVFCCFNGNWKITPEMFDIWMRLLKLVPGSVLWLLAESSDAQASLGREATLRDVDPQRLVFAPRAPQSSHLARHRLAGLFLDTLPYNAHTTANDALWAGLPVITCPGRNFAGRVAASLLAAVGLPELICETLEDYERLALALAREPARLAALKSKLADNIKTQPLFDTVRFTRGIEAAYTRIWARHQSGFPAESFRVPDPEGAASA